MECRHSQRLVSPNVSLTKVFYTAHVKTWGDHLVLRHDWLSCIRPSYHSTLPQEPCPRGLSSVFDRYLLFSPGSLHSHDVPAFKLQPPSHIDHRYLLLLRVCLLECSVREVRVVVASILEKTLESALHFGDPGLDNLTDALLSLLDKDVPENVKNCAQYFGLFSNFAQRVTDHRPTHTCCVKT